jgi:hypothetical protein
MSPFSKSSFQQRPLPNLTQSLALLCVEFLASELAFTHPNLDRVKLSAVWNEEVAERIQQFGGTVERHYQNLLFIAFDGETAAVDKLETSLAFVRSLYTHPLPVVASIPSLKLRFGLALEDVQNRNPMGASTERSLAEGGQLIVSDVVVQAMGQKRYPFIPLSGESPIARRGRYYVLRLYDESLMAPPESMRSAGLQGSDVASPKASRPSSVQPEGINAPLADQSTPIKESFSFLNAPASILGDFTSEEDGFTEFSHDQAGFSVEQDVALHNLEETYVAPVEKNTPPQTTTPLLAAKESSSLHNPEHTSPLAMLSPVGLPHALMSTPPVVEEEPALPPVLRMMTPASNQNDAIPNQEEKRIHQARLHLYDTPPAWPEAPGVELWNTAPTPALREAIQYSGFQSVVESLFQQFSTRLQANMNGEEPPAPAVMILEAESGLGSTTAFTTARHHLDAALLAPSEVPSDEDEPPEAPYLVLQAGPYQHRTGLPYPLELWHQVCRSLFQFPVEGYDQTAVRPTIQHLLFYITAEEDHPRIAPFLNTLVRFMGDDAPLAEGETYADIAETFAWLLTQLSSLKPVILQLENLEQADGASIYLLQLLMGQYELVKLPNVSWWLHHAPKRLLAVVDDSWLESHVRIQHLTPLTAPEAQYFVSEGMLAGVDVTTLPPAFMAGLIELTHGKPFYLEEGVRYALEEGVISQDEATGTLEVSEAIHQFTWPESMEALWQKRLAFLPEEVAKVLQLAGILGHRFSIATLTSLLGAEEDVAQQFLGFLWQHGWLIPDGADSVMFRHSELLGVLRAMLHQDDMQHMHAWVLESLSQEFEQPLVIPEPLVAYHAFYTPAPVKLEAYTTAWAERISPLAYEWLPQLQEVLSLNQPNLEASYRIATLRNLFAQNGDMAAERQLMRCEAYAAFQEGTITLSNEQAFESLLMIGDEQRDAGHLGKATHLYTSALELSQAKGWVGSEDADFMAGISLFTVAWLAFDLPECDKTWKRLATHGAWNRSSTRLLPWKLEALNTAFRLLTLQVQNAEIKRWYQYAQLLWGQCIEAELNPLLIARSQMAYGYYLHAKGAYPAFNQILLAVKDVLNATQEGMPLLHESLVEYTQLQWLEDKYATHLPEVRRRYEYLREDLELRGGNFQSLHQTMLMGLCKAALAPRELAPIVDACKEMGLGLMLNELLLHIAWQALAAKQVQQAHDAVEEWISLFTIDVLKATAPLLYWWSQLLKARILVLQKQYKTAAQQLFTCWEPVAKSLLGHPLITYLSLLAHIHHCLAYTPALAVAVSNDYKAKSNNFAQKAVFLSRQGQHLALEDLAKYLMQYG